MKAAVLIALGMAFGAGFCGGQAALTPFGTVLLQDATIEYKEEGLHPVSGGRASLTGNSTVTALSGRNADVALVRGGSLLVCQTTAVHLGTGNGQSLLLGVDRGAMEMRMKADAGDAIMTPDMRFTMSGSGQLDLRVRVTRNGDTCVENRGRKAPTLNITNAFGDASYQVKPGQHVLFEHGNLHEVVDRETTPCGCPPLQRPGVSIAEAMLNSGKGTVTPKQAEAANPFPAAVSDGLADPGPPPAETPAGGTHLQVATTLVFDPNALKTADTPDATAVPSAPAALVLQPANEPEKGGPFRAVGRFSSESSRVSRSAA